MGRTQHILWLLLTWRDWRMMSGSSLLLLHSLSPFLPFFRGPFDFSSSRHSIALLSFYLIPPMFDFVICPKGSFEHNYSYKVLEFNQFFEFLLCFMLFESLLCCNLQSFGCKCVISNCCRLFMLGLLCPEAQFLCFRKEDFHILRNLIVI